MVKHTVMFRLRGSREERLACARRFCRALEALPGQIPCLMAMETGINANPSEEWDVVLTATLPTMDDVARYAAHPAHLAAAAIVAPLKEARACVDYEA